jgi:RNase P/RNase MRP subunit p29
MYPLKNAIVPDELTIPENTEMFFVTNRPKEELVKLQEQLTMVDFGIGQMIKIPADTEQKTVYIVGKELKHDEQTITVRNKIGEMQIKKNPNVKFEVVDI